MSSNTSFLVCIAMHQYLRVLACTTVHFEAQKQVCPHVAQVEMASDSFALVSLDDSCSNQP